MADSSTAADGDGHGDGDGDALEAGAIVRDSVQESRVVVLEQTAVAANEYFLLETQSMVAQCRRNRREWADDPVVEAVYESDIRRVFGDCWHTADVLEAYRQGTLDQEMTRYRFPTGRLEVIDSGG